MNLKKQVFILSISIMLLVGMYSPLSAGRLQGSLYFDMGFPQGEFKDNLDATGLGVGLNIGVQLNNSPVVLGVDMAIMNYGTDKRYESFIGIPELTVGVVTSYNVFQGLAFLRLQPIENGAISPYAEVLAGLNYFWAETSLEADGWGDELFPTVNFDDVTFCYGVGGGIAIRLSKTKANPSKPKPMEFFLDMRARYLFGGEAQYLQEGSIEIHGESATYYYNESKTKLLTLQIGFGLKF